MRRFWLLLCLSSVVAGQSCTENASDGTKVRISLASGLKDKAYMWNENEMFLFRSTLAYAMRKHMQGSDFQVSNILVCRETQRVSFWFVVTSSMDNSTLISKEMVREAVRKSRDRINGAFQLTDQTLEFLGIEAIMPPQPEHIDSRWMIVFSVFISLVVFVLLLMIMLSVVQKKRKRNEKTKKETCEEEIYRNTVVVQGICNSTFSD
ncbi:collectrin [Pholidichthys leucotaenia]